jgi:peptidoglycan/xylan/chitin deacetylase (PgdA/CDA1 family)
VKRIGLAAALLLAAAPAGAASQYFELERIPTHRKLAALTFDGGGATATGTQLILGTLRRRHVPATFFVSGRSIRLHPAGARDARTVAVVNALGYTSVRWSVDTWGWMGRTEGQSVGTVVHRFEERLRPGAIVLMHLGAARDGSLLDARALPRVIAVTKRRGYRFVTLDRWVRPPR